MDKENKSTLALSSKNIQFAKTPCGKLFKNLMNESLSFSTSTSHSLGENDTDSFLSSFLEIDDLLECEQYIETLIKSLKGHKLGVSSACLQLRTFYFKSCLIKQLPRFLLKQNANLSQLSEKYFKILHIVLLITYDSSFNHSLFKCVLCLLNKSLIQLHRVILIFCNYFIHHIDMSNIAKNDMMKSINSKLLMRSDNHLTEVSNVMNKLTSYVDKLILTYKMTSIGNEIQGFYDNILFFSIEDIDLFFQGEVIRDSPLKEREDDKITYVSLNSIQSNSVNIPHYNKYSLTPLTVNNTKKYFTLVLDLDETLIHFVSGNDLEGKVLFRPFLFEFLNNVSHYFEIIVFTASIKGYADIILNLIEAKIGFKVFDHRLYREHTTSINGKVIKDLSKIGRDLSKILIVDNLPETFSYQKDNGICIDSFLGLSKNDRCLFELAKILVEIAKTKPTDDIRIHLTRFNKDIKTKVSMLGI